MLYLLGRRGTDSALLGRMPTSALLLPSAARWASLEFWVDGGKWAPVRLRLRLRFESLGSRGHG
jgi:hypothetical protein